MNIEQTIKVLRALAQEWHECCGDIHIPLNEAADTIERLCAGALKDANKYAKAKFEPKPAFCECCGRPQSQPYVGDPQEPGDVP